MLTAEQLEKRRMRNKKILHGLEETGKYLGKIAIDSGLAEKAVKLASKVGRKKARLLGKEGKDAVKLMEADALAGLKKFRGKLEHKSWAEKNPSTTTSAVVSEPPPISLPNVMSTPPPPYPGTSMTPSSLTAVTMSRSAAPRSGSNGYKSTSKDGMKGGMVGPAGTHYFYGRGKHSKPPTVGSRRQVFGGYALRTSGGLTKDKLMKNAAGRIVSRAKSAFGKERGIKFLTDKGYVAKKGEFKLFRKQSTAT